MGEARAFAFCTQNTQKRAWTGSRDPFKILGVLHIFEVEHFSFLYDCDKY